MPSTGPTCAVSNRTRCLTAMFDALVLSCEHGGNRVPPRYKDRFKDAEKLLESHRGYDLGALAVARRMAAALGAPLFYSRVSRLVVDLNRSQHHPRLFSEFLRDL